MSGVLRCAGLVAVGLLMATGSGCARLGFTDRVLHRIPSPNGQTFAVCQEIPEFDGPSFDVRLERPDGTHLRDLFRMGDGGGCSEMAWSDDGRVLAVLTSHVAGVSVVDVEWALAHPDTRNSHWFVRGFGYSRERDGPTYARQLTFVSPQELQFEICRYSLEETQQRRGEIRCAESPHPKRLRIPRTLDAGGRP